MSGVCVYNKWTSDLKIKKGLLYNLISKYSIINNVRNSLETTEEVGIFFSKKRGTTEPPKTCRELVTETELQLKFCNWRQPALTSRECFLFKM